MPSNKVKKKSKSIGYCGSCGDKVPLNRKYITKCFSMGKTNQVLFIGYVCPKCRSHTDITYKTNEDTVPFLKWLDLYKTGFYQLKEKKK